MAAQEELAELAAALDAGPEQFTALAELAPAQLAVLKQGFLEARRRQRADMEQAIKNALGHIPALLRGPVLKILGR